MKLIKYEQTEELLTADTTKVFTDSSITIDTTVANVNGRSFIDFVPRISPNVNDIDISITVDSTLILVDSDITVDTTSTTVSDGLIVHITNEFTKEEYNVPTDIEVLSNSTYRLYFLDSNFIKPESKYSIDIKSSEDTLYQGKVMVTTKDIQNYRYTTINNNKLYL